ncbi:amino acid adenylation domain-containing protein [Paenibacillus sp. MZ04-78.2]|uniref:amino acid adenylation domain-containing protein n=1 Tax=Paenibacillus sp. MZ04-78.2 TaxID=2962034 RepID=UPI0020B7B23B|nr:non-ribosomal peptide synthetase [Paenibacillus sp. MZ04-78.2]MCP3774857.1 amino acid adenylation domain-containing protein [Paenibacillus sp. MZ04-78.2]
MSGNTSQEEYWVNVFDEEDRLSVLPPFKAADSVSWNREAYREECWNGSLSQAVSKRITDLANGSEMAVYLLVAAGMQCLLSHYTDRSSVIVGIPTTTKKKGSSSVINPIVPFKHVLNSGSTFSALFTQLKEGVAQVLRHQNVPFPKMVQHLDMLYPDEHTPLFPIVISLNELHGFTFKEEIFADTLFHFDLENNSLNVKVYYNGSLYDRPYLEQVVAHLDRMLAAALFQPNAPLHGIEMLREAEKQQILFHFNDTAVDFSESRTTFQLFEEQVKRTPNHTAVKLGSQQLTYRELDTKANQLARILRNYGVQPDTLVAIMTERSLEMVVAMLAVWKAGGAYVPLDPQYPQERLQHMLQVAKAGLLLVQGDVEGDLRFAGTVLDLNDEASYHPDGSALLPIAQHHHLAYVIYTSGTTGKPKGVMIEHSGIANALQWKKALFHFPEQDRVLVLYPYVFDAFILNFFGPLVSGATLYLLPEEENKDLFAIQKVLTEEKITRFTTSPRLLSAMIAQMKAEDLRYVQHVVVGGEQLEPATVERLFALRPQIRLINEYGPTENSVITTFHPVHTVHERITIGKPVANNQVYILGTHGHIQPIGVPGELFVAGAGVARGYLHQPELTKQKFVPHLLANGQTMYQTGDSARWLPNGTIEYLGRIDQQVKIRGFRIELGDVETALLSLDAVHEAVVTTRKDKDGADQLVAYYTGEFNGTVSQFRDLLSHKLPDYMIPSVFIHLEQIPLTTNGKLDRKALPDAEDKTRAEREYVAPRNEVEELLSSIWQTVLGAEKIGIQDSFFDFGGDSIKSLQVSSRLYQAGYKVDMKYMFNYPTIAELSPWIEPVSRIAEQGEVKGSTRFSPIQHWFFEQKMPNFHHYNQAVMIHSPHGFQEAPLRSALSEIAKHHDALRMIVEEQSGGYSARIAAIDESKLFELEIVSCQEDTDPGHVIESHANRIQSSIDVSRGPLLKVGLFRCADGDHLLFVVHHLVIDGVSWRILLEDFASGYEQAVQGQSIRLPQKTDSFSFWAEQVEQYASGTAIEQELAYWVELAGEPIRALPKDYDHPTSFVEDSDVITVQWTQEETERLLMQANRAYNTEMNDLLLTSLGRAVHLWTGMEKMAVNLEGHGREPILPDLDISRTVGWFTSQYPVILHIEAGKSLPQHIKSVKETLRRVPAKGMNYGILKQVSGRSEAGLLHMEPDISFNYLGQFDQSFEDHAYQLSPYSSGSSMNGQQRRTAALELNGMIAEGVLTLSLSYSRKQYNSSSIEQFAQLLRDSLQQIVTHCVDQPHSSLTPSDVLLKDITIDELDQLLEQTREFGIAEQIYPLTPMQKGMLFHSLLDPSSAAYFQQTRFDLNGWLDIQRFTESLEALAQKYEIFRTNFYRGWKDQPLQMVWKDKKIGLSSVDLREMDETGQERSVREYARQDRLRGFDLAKDALMRVSILHMSDTRYHFIWSFHHILMDGWCLPLITEEIFGDYFARMQQKQLPPSRLTPYRVYMEWLDEQNEEEARRYWDQYLDAYSEQTLLPKDGQPAEDEPYLPEQVTGVIDAELALRLKESASRHHVTLNTLLQTAWGVLLHTYNSSQDAVFGSVVSGRPAAIPNVETMIGLFINTIPVRIQGEASITFAELMRRTQEKAIASQHYETYPLYEIQARTIQKQHLITHLMVFENYPVGQYMESIGGEYGSPIEISKVQMEEQTNYDLNVIVIPGETIRLQFTYNARVYNRATIERMQGHLLHILQQVARDADVRVSELDILTDQERTTLLHTWNDTAAEFPQALVYRLFEAQSLQTPDRPAVIAHGQQLTYVQLNERANQLARHVRARSGQANPFVAVISEHSIELVIGILAVLKAGGAYVPIDPDYPEDRIRYMLDDSKACLVLTQSHLRRKFDFEGMTVLLDEESSYDQDCSNLEEVGGANDLAYMIYTSGSTGKPKGVLIEHRGLTNYIWWAREVYVKGEPTNFPLYSSISFDLTVTSIFTPLVTGNAIIVFSGADKAALLASIVQDPRVDIIKLTPAHLQAWKEMNIAGPTTVRKLIVGGENLSTRLAQSIHEQLHGEIEIFNEYGPTETVVGCMIHRYDAALDKRESVPIGKAAANTSLFLLNHGLKPVPVGVPGELFISGAGVARGYWNRPELTAEKFIDHPFVPGTRMYRTGDLAQWLPDGKMEYLGRMDEQVKIRGYRIEIGEIEAALQQMAEIKEAVVAAQTDAHGFQQLCAYYVSDRPLPSSQLREHLSRGLPGFMVPAYFVHLEQMPLTSNGKLNRKALPVPDLRHQERAAYRAPRTKVEEMLVSIWEAILGTEGIGIGDHFFDLGGDSIKSIQLSSRLNQLGYRLEIKHLFKFPTIAELSPHVELSRRAAEQGEAVGRVMLTPIQYWFFEQFTVDPHYYNQAVMLHAPDGLKEMPLRQTLHKLAEHHDALRMVAVQTENGYEAWNLEIARSSLYQLEVFDLQENPAPGPDIEAKANEIQGSIRLSDGPWMKAALFRCADGDHLFIAIHHLAVDGISWRILLEDIASGYKQAERGQAIRLPLKTDSFRLWSERLTAYAQSEAMSKEAAYWSQLEQRGFECLPKDFPEQDGFSRDSETVTVEWSKEETDQLIKHAHRAYNTDMNDLLITSLGLSVSRWSGLERIALHLEGHGREPIIPDLDISRTVGWFTSLFPVVLQLPPGKPLSASIKAVKEELRHIPHKGIGYGILKYLAKTEVPRSGLQPEISFNYLGQFDQDLQQHEIRLSQYSAGSDSSGNQRRPYVLNVNGMITGGQLRLTINYSHKQYARETIERLSAFLHQELRAVVAHCMSKEQPELTPSDILLQGLTVNELDQLLDQLPDSGAIENIYPLTPMQKGMLFHSLLNAESGAYFEQASFDLDGEVRIEALGASLERVFDQYAVLRTRFYNGWNDVPLQIVYRKQKPEIYVSDLRGIEEAQRDAALQAFRSEDRERGFDLTQGPLMRVAIFRVQDRRYHLIWSFHHIVMDGWCLPLVTREVFNHYFTLLKGQEAESAYTPPFSEYIEWLQRQDVEAAKRYWNEYLEGYEGQTRILRKSTPQAQRAYAYASVTCRVDRDQTRLLQQIASRHQVTLNILVQTLWGILLQKYNGTNDVVFGSVVSGRPADIPGVEQMIGLFINTVPVRVVHEEQCTFVEAMKVNQEKALASRSFDTYPLYEIQAQTEQKQALIDHLVIFENYPVGERIEQAGHDVAQLSIANFHMEEHSHYDFNVLVIPHEQLEIHFGFNQNVYEPSEVERIGGHLQRLLDQAAHQPHLQIKDMELLTPQEKERLLEGVLHWRMNDPSDATRAIHQWFEEQAARTPMQTAVVYEEERVTYDELNKRANQLARTLRNAGVKDQQLVGIRVERSIEMMVGILAVLKAGGAYLPIDPDIPAERFQYILQDSDIQVLLVQDDWTEQAAFSGTCLNLRAEHAYLQADDNLMLPCQPGQLAYVIYTSGTTGKPKGVMIEHRQVVHLVEGLRSEIFAAYDEALRVAMLAPYYFDASVQQIFATLLLGHTLFVVPKATVSDAAALCRYYREHRIDVSDGTPSHLKLLAAGGSMDGVLLRHLLIGGEALPETTVTRFLQLFAFHDHLPVITNVYGPTETCVDASLFHIIPAAPDWQRGQAYLLIGKPIGNNRMYVLDSQLRLQPVGVPGELYIAGDGVGRGYLNLHELTNATFLEDPFVPLSRMYKTGDLACLLPDGNLDYLGRIDHQVKIRGFRIEPGEIEAVMLNQPLIQEAVVVVWEDALGEPELCGYFVAEAALPPGELRAALAERLPAYMVPTSLVQVERIPLTANGKLNRKGLPAPDGQRSAVTEYMAPRNETEQQLEEIWKGILGVSEIGVRDHFFDIGGHSLRATALVAAIQKRLNVQIPLRKVFELPTIERLAQEIMSLEHSAYASIPVIAKRPYYPVSSAQKRLFILGQLEGGQLSYNMPAFFKVKGRPDKDRLYQAFAQLVRRHESLRTGFRMADGEPVQFVLDQVNFSIDYYQDSAQDADGVIRRFVRAFELEQPPLLRVGLLELQPDEMILLFDMHHIISDGTSISILIQEFVRLYEGSALDPLRIQYKDYAAWQTGEARTLQLQKQEAYWLDVFRGDLPVLHMPTDEGRPTHRSFVGATLHFSLDERRSSGLRRLALETDSTLFMLLLATYTVLLSKYSGQEDIIVGTPIAGRPHADLDFVIGMFVNTLALRNYPAKEKSFTQLLAEVKEHALQAYEHQDYPFEKLVERLDLTRDLSRNPLFDTMLVLQNNEQAALQAQDVAFEPYHSEHTMAKFDLTLTAVEDEGRIHFTMEYLTSLFNPQTIERMMQHYAQLIDAVLERPEASLASLDMMSLSEKTEIRERFNGPTTNHERFSTIHQRFEEQAERTPDQGAVWFNEEIWTYRELNERSNQLARALRGAGVGTDRAVAVMTERSANLIIGMMAILKAGGAFLPIAPELPEERRSFMLQDSGAGVLLIRAGLTVPPSFKGTVIRLDDSSVYQGDTSNLSLSYSEKDLLYIIYTSGTTGQPKGVELEHKTLVNLLAYEWAYTPVRFDHVLQFAAMSFDVCYQEIFSTILCGGTLYIIDEEAKRDIRRLHDFVRVHGVRTVFLPTAFFKLLASEKMNLEPLAENVDHIIVAGEQLVVTSLVRDMLAEHKVMLHNHYGPSETHVVTMHTVDPESRRELPPIGKPISNTELFIANESGKLQPIGVVGELCIAGVSLARGYHNQEALTRDKFIPHPYSANHRMYKTGDLARYLPDGTIEYAGRMDHQVKIRGYRIELAEVEAALLRTGEVREAVVLARTGADGQSDLYAYFVADHSVSARQLREKLSAQLPGYMIPLYMMQLEQMPLTSNGKVNRSVLPLPEASSQAGEGFVAPRTELEKQLAHIWEEVLKLENVGVTDSFFDLGGHSLRGMTLISRIHTQFKRNFSLRDVFQYPTIEEMATLLASSEVHGPSHIPAAEVKAAYPVTSVQKLIYLSAQIEGGELGYNMPGILMLEGKIDVDRLRMAFEALIQRHESLRTGFEMIQGEPMQVIHPEVEFFIEMYRATEEETESIIRSFIRAFDLSRAPLLRCGLIEWNPEQHIFMFDMHHMITDGASMTIFVEELMQLYEGRELIPLRIQFKDFTVWQQQEKQKERIRNQENYWLQVFHTEVSPLELPNDLPRPPIRSFEGQRYDFVLDASLIEGVKQIEDMTGSTTYMVLLAVYASMLAKYSGQDDLVIGTPIAGRVHEDVQNIIGMFVNTLAIRTAPVGEKTFIEYVHELRETMLEAYEHQEYPFEQLVEKLGVKRDLSRNPLFDTMFVFQNTEQTEMTLETIAVKPYEQTHTVAKFDLQLNFAPAQEGLQGSFDYCTKLFKKKTIAAMASDYMLMLTAVIENPAIPLNELSLSQKTAKSDHFASVIELQF